jgi:hypothetical protein
MDDKEVLGRMNELAREEHEFVRARRRVRGRQARSVPRVFVGIR